MTEFKLPPSALRSDAAPLLRPVTTTLRPAPALGRTLQPRRVQQATQLGTLPNTVIIGAMKCGTTSLHEYLSYHPDISMSRRKETDFFVKERNWSKGLGWYQENFQERAQVVGESSPNYARFPLFPGVPERLQRVIPRTKLIYCVRDPLKRMLSHYVHSYSLGRENRPLEHALLEPQDNAYHLCSAYYFQLEQYLRHFDASRIKIVVLEDLYRDPESTMQDVFEFLGVDSSYRDDRFSNTTRTMPPAATRRRSPLKSWMVRNNVRGYYWLERNFPGLFGKPIPKPQLSDDLRAQLSERLAPDVQALRQFSGHALSAWKL